MNAIKSKTAVILRYSKDERKGLYALHHRHAADLQSRSV